MRFGAKTRARVSYENTSSIHDEEKETHELVFTGKTAYFTPRVGMPHHLYLPHSFLTFFMMKLREVFICIPKSTNNLFLKFYMKIRSVLSFLYFPLEYAYDFFSWNTVSNQYFLVSSYFLASCVISKADISKVSIPTLNKYSLFISSFYVVMSNPKCKTFVEK